jgi:hypothetical protein
VPGNVPHPQSKSRGGILPLNPPTISAGMALLL